MAATCGAQILRGKTTKEFYQNKETKSSYVSLEMISLTFAFAFLTGKKLGGQSSPVARVKVAIGNRRIDAAPTKVKYI